MYALNSSWHAIGIKWVLISRS